MWECPWSDAHVFVAGGAAEHLSLLKNPVTRIKNYRLYTIHKIPTLLTLDFTRVKQKVRPCHRALVLPRPWPWLTYIMSLLLPVPSLWWWCVQERDAARALFDSAEGKAMEKSVNKAKSKTFAIGNVVGGKEEERPLLPEERAAFEVCGAAAAGLPCRPLVWLLLDAHPAGWLWWLPVFQAALASTTTPEEVDKVERMLKAGAFRKHGAGSNGKASS